MPGCKAPERSRHASRVPRRRLRGRTTCPPCWVLPRSSSISVGHGRCFTIFHLPASKRMRRVVARSMQEKRGAMDRMVVGTGQTVRHDGPVLPQGQLVCQARYLLPGVPPGWAGPDGHVRSGHRSCVAHVRCEWSAQRTLEPDGAGGVGADSDRNESNPAGCRLSTRDALPSEATAGMARPIVVEPCRASGRNGGGTTDAIRHDPAPGVLVDDRGRLGKGARSPGREGTQAKSPHPVRDRPRRL